MPGLPAPCLHPVFFIIYFFFLNLQYSSEKPLLQCLKHCPVLSPQLWQFINTCPTVPNTPLSLAELPLLLTFPQGVDGHCLPRWLPLSHRIPLGTCPGTAHGWWQKEQEPDWALTSPGQCTGCTRSSVWPCIALLSWLYSDLCCRAKQLPATHAGSYSWRASLEEGSSSHLDATSISCKSLLGFFSTPEVPVVPACNLLALFLGPARADPSYVSSPDSAGSPGEKKRTIKR